MWRNGGDRPGFFDGADVGHRYRSEFEMTAMREVWIPQAQTLGEVSGLLVSHAACAQVVRCATSA
jgi:hypothetical protein